MKCGKENTLMRNFNLNSIETSFSIKNSLYGFIITTYMEYGIQEEIAKYPDIYMYDLESYNIMFDWYKKRFYIIDTDIWQPLDNSMEINQDRLATQLMLLITNRILKWRSHVYNDKKNLKELYSHFVCFKDTRLVLPIFIKELEKNVSSEVGKIKTLGELKLPRK